MKVRADLMFSVVCAAALLVAGNAFAMGGRLSPQDFNKMYYLAQNGKVGILRNAINRGLNIDAVNPNGDTGLCIAVKRKDHIAYNTFRMSGANPRHQCTYRMYREYQEFLEGDKAAKIDKVVGNEESLYYEDNDRSWWPWILGGAALGGGIWALSSGGGGSKSHDDSTIIQPQNEYGLSGLINKYHKLVDKTTITNKLNLNGTNPNAAQVVDNIKLLPNMLDNADYLQAYIKIINGGAYDNLAGGNIILGDASVGMAAFGAQSSGDNNGTILIDARNGSVGMVASNGAAVYNNSDRADDEVNGRIDIAFKGGKEGDAVIGMYADTGGVAVNYGQINGTSTKTTVEEEDGADIGDAIVGDGEGERVTSANSGSVVGMAAFDFYTGTNNSATTVRAENHGDINLSAGYNAATDVSVNLVGMGSYVDDKFLNGTSNPAFAEHMQLDNYGDISLRYDGTYNVSETALKLGDGGLIGMRADASTQAVNQGNVHLELTSTAVADDMDMAAGMLSVHGAELINGTSSRPYAGVGESGGTIRITNEATSGGVVYGMLAAKGDGTQTKIYKWKAPKVYNYGLVDMQTSNAYAMASFSGGEVVNRGVINLGVEKGDSYYTQNFGIYGGGGTDTSNVSLINDGIINVYAKKSTAIYNAFAGAVTLKNNGRIYLSNKATGSSAIGGSFSEAVNAGVIDYKVGGSEKASISGIVSAPGYATSIPMENSVVSVGDSKTEKQLFTNETGGYIIIGGERGAQQDYGGTYVTAGVRVKNQGAASNKGMITLVEYDIDTPQVNAGMWLDDSTTNEAYINNRGEIVVNSTASVGMRNASDSGAEATNYGHITVNGRYSYGMSTVGSGPIFNGRAQNHIGDATVPIAKTITVNGDGAAGMYIKGTGVGYNYGDIVLTGDNATAVILDEVDQKYEHFYNYGNILYTGGRNQTFYWLANKSARNFVYPELEVDGYTFAKLTGESVAGFTGKAEVKGENSHLFVVEDSTVQNSGDILVTGGATAIVVEGEGNISHNAGILTVGDADSAAVGIDAKDGGTSVTINSRLEVNNGTGVIVREAASVTNQDIVEVTRGIGLDISGKDVEGEASEGINSGTISALGTEAIGVRVSNGAKFDNKDGKIVAANGGTGVQSSSTWVNDGNIEVSGTESIGVEVLDFNFTNKGDINVTTGKGIAVSGGTATNAGTINVADGYGMYVDGANAKAINSKRIVVSGSGYGAYVNQGQFTNSGTIEYYSDRGGTCVGGNASASGTCTDLSAMEMASLMYVGNNAKFINQGKVVMVGEAVDFDSMREESGSFIVGNGGTFAAESFKGEITAGKDIVMSGFDDKYVNEGAFKGENAGLEVSSQSYLFDAEVKEAGDKVLDVELNRKKFEEVVEEKDLAAFWEANYQLQHNGKMYNALKSAETEAEFDEVKKVESGKNFYANLPRENMAVLRGLHTQEQNRILEEGIDGTYIGADYYRTGKDASGDLSGYADNVYSPYVGYGKRFNRNWSAGGTLRAAYVDAEYDEAHSSRNNKILLASLPILYQNDSFKFLTAPSVGVGFGEYEREALSGSYEADTFDLYYGMYNHAEYSVDMKVAELVLEAELNLQGSSMSKAKEDNEGLNLHSNDSLSLESGVGVKLRKRIELAKQRSLMLAVGVKYYHEFLDPYKDLTVGMSDSPVNYKVNAYDENKDRIRTSAEAVYKDGDFSVAAEIAHNIEKENNVEGGVGVRYSF